MLAYRHYKLHLRFDIVWLVTQNHLEFLKMYPGYLLEIWKLVRMDLKTPSYGSIEAVLGCMALQNDKF